METPEMTPEQKQYDLYCRIREERNYWKERCRLTEKLMMVFPIGGSQQIGYTSAHKAYNDFLTNNKEPK